MRTILLVASAALALGACTAQSARVTFDGNYYPTREKGIDREDRHLFETTVRRVEQGFDAAVAAGLHGGTRYCIKNFGTSEIDWITPTDPAMVERTSGNLVLRGRCVTW